MLRPSIAAALVAALTLVGCGPSLESATSLELTQIPATVTAGQPIEITVTVKNEKGETVTAYNSPIHASIQNAVGTEGLEGETTVTAKNGVAEFTLALTRAAPDQKIVFRPDQQDGKTRVALKLSSSIDVSPGAPDHLNTLATPKKGAPGGVLFPFALVQVVDKYGNLVTSNVTITAALGANPTGATLGGTVTRTAVDGQAQFGDLTVDKAGTGYTLVFSATGVTSMTTAAFDVGAPRLVYTDPTTGSVLLVRNAASTDTVVVLDVKLGSAGANGAYSAGLNLPVDLRTVKAPATGAIVEHKGGLNPGLAPAAIVGALHTQGVGAGILTAGISQKAAGAGAVTSNVNIPGGTVLFSIRLEVQPQALFKTVFDGADLGPGFAAGIRNKLGEDVDGARGFTWGIGKLEVQ